jgi:hypothetical protein
MARRPSSEATGEEQLELFEAVLTDVSVKVDMASLEHPLFSIGRHPLKVPRCSSCISRRSSAPP